jgi:NhaA family Na+:H+ antiporter
LAGVGFTMSLFISSLAFDPAAAEYQQAKLGVLCASLIAGAVGFVLLKKSIRRPTLAEPSPAS